MRPKAKAEERNGSDASIRMLLEDPSIQREMRRVLEQIREPRIDRPRSVAGEMMVKAVQVSNSLERAMYMQSMELPDMLAQLRQRREMEGIGEGMVMERRVVALPVPIDDSENETAPMVIFPPWVRR